MFKTNSSRHTDEEIKKMKVSELKYNIARQELYLKFLKQVGVLYGDGIKIRGRFKKYNAFIEETQIPPLSICRLIQEGKDRSIRSWLVSPYYDEKNPFNILGFNGHLLSYNHKTWCVGWNQDLRFQKMTGPYTCDRLPYPEQGTLIFIQGQPERAFNLAASNYDMAFGDVFDPADVETMCFYNELYSYMKDFYENNSYFGAEVLDYNKKIDNKQYRLIYCPKRVI